MTVMKLGNPGPIRNPHHAAFPVQLDLFPHTLAQVKPHDAAALGRIGRVSRASVARLAMAAVTCPRKPLRRWKGKP